MKKITTFLFFIILSLNVFAINDKALTTTNLNLREDQSVDSKSLKVINEGDTVEIISKNLNWSKVIHGQTEGYVATEYITPISSETLEYDDNEIKSRRSNLTSALFYAILIIVFGYLLYWTFTRKCSNCGKFGSLRKNGSELIDSRPTKVKEVLKQYNNKNEVISKREVLVNATIKKYRDFYICKKCNQTTTKISSITVKN